MRKILAAALSLVIAMTTAIASCSDVASGPDEPDGARASGDEAMPDAGLSDARALDAIEDGSLSDVDAKPFLADTCGDAGVLSGAWVVDAHLCLTVFADARTLTLPRQMAFAPNGDLFVETGGAILALFDVNGDGTITPEESSTYVGPFSGLALTHSVAFGPAGTFVYASSATTVYRWRYQVGDRVANGAPETVVANLPADGHSTRTLAFDPQGRLYVSVGSQDDVDLEPQLLALRSQIRRFTVPSPLRDGGLAYEAGEVVASGLRNEVGLAFDSMGRFWGVENGSDGAYLPASSQDSPAEEINRFDGVGSTFFGYPYCWTAFDLLSTQFAYATPDPKSDGWCRNATVVHPPAAGMQAHWAPLGITGYDGPSFPWKGDLFVASHGSSARVPAVGRLIARAQVTGDKVVAVTPLAGHLVDGGLEQGTWDARPVDVRVGPEGALYFSDDSSARILRLGYRP